jgi:hypothetical protein
MNLVVESLDELHSFERRKDALGALGIGQKQLIKDWLDEMGVEGYAINDDCTIDVNTNVNLSHKNLEEFPWFIQFNKVYAAAFFCFRNRLVSLRGCPTYVGRTFSCVGNKLNSLKGCPSYVGNKFVCADNDKFFTKDYVRSLCRVKDEIINKL